MKFKLPGLLFIVAIIGLAACKKNNDAPPVTYQSNLNVVNASADTVNFYLNGTRLNDNSNLYPAGASGYFFVLYGAQNYQVKKTFNRATSIVQPLFSIPLTLDTGKYYSLFIAGETSALAFSTLDTLVSDTSTSTCLVRFVNASPDAGSLDFAIGSSLKFTGEAFKSASGFRSVDTGSLVPLMLYHSGSSTPVISGHFPLLAGRSYTFYSKGTLNGTGSTAFSIGALVNVN